MLHCKLLTRVDICGVYSVSINLDLPYCKHRNAVLAMEKNAQCKKDLDVKERHCKIKETITQRREIISACYVNETKTRTW